MKQKIIVLLVLASSLFHCMNNDVAVEDRPEKKTTALTDAQRLQLQNDYYNSFSVRCVDLVQSYSGTELTGFGQIKAFGPPTGSGQNSGSLDVFVLGENEIAVFQISGYTISNQAGIDFKVFENGFEVTGNTGTFSWDLGFVEVSPDGISWYGFSPTHDTPNNQLGVKSSLVGLNPVTSNYLDNAIDPKLTNAGGDGFDLSNAKLITDNSSGNPLTYTYGSALSQNIRYIKIIDGGSNLPDDQVVSNGVDIDAICGFNLVAD